MCHNFIFVKFLIWWFYRIYILQQRMSITRFPFTQFFSTWCVSGEFAEYVWSGTSFSKCEIRVMRGTLSPYLSALDFSNSPVWNIQLDFFSKFELDFSPVKFKLAKSKIPFRVVKNVISKWTKMNFPRFLSFWFIAVAVVNPPDRKLVMYISVNCRKGVNS